MKYLIPYLIASIITLSSCSSAPVAENTVDFSNITSQQETSDRANQPTSFNLHHQTKY
jgi:hypothetical protein